jgi:hypothetical protein
MRTLISTLAAVLIWNVADAQVGSTLKEGAKATGEKSEQYGDQAKAAVSSQPNKAANKAKAQVHKAKAHDHAKSAKDAAKEIPK